MTYFLFIALFLPLVMFAQAVGTTIAIFGVVKVQRNSREYDLERGAEIFIRDKIIVAAESYAKLRFTDGTILSLIPESNYNIDSYSYTEGGKNNSFASEIVKGGLRCLTGDIAKTNPEAYTVKTPTATLGVRGTIFRIRITADGVFIGCDSGAVAVTNREGSSDLSPTTGSRFAIVSSSDSSASVMSNEPTDLSQSNFMPPTGGCR